MINVGLLAMSAALTAILLGCPRRSICPAVDGWESPAMAELTWQQVLY